MEKAKPSYFGVAFEDKPKDAENTSIQTMFFTAKEDKMLECLLATDKDLKDKTRLYCFQTTDDELKQDSIQPFHISQFSDTEVILVAAIDGELAGFQDDPDGETPEACYVSNILRDACAETMDKAGDFTKFMEAVESDGFQKKHVLPHLNPRGSLAIMLSEDNGIRVFSKNNSLFKKMEGWWTSRHWDYGEKKEEKSSDPPAGETTFERRKRLAAQAAAGKKPEEKKEEKAADKVQTTIEIPAEMKGRARRRFCNAHFGKLYMDKISDDQLEKLTELPIADALLSSPIRQSVEKRYKSFKDLPRYKEDFARANERQVTADFMPTQLADTLQLIAKSTPGSPEELLGLLDARKPASEQLKLAHGLKDIYRWSPDLMLNFLSKPQNALCLTLELMKTLAEKDPKILEIPQEEKKEEEQKPEEHKEESTFERRKRLAAAAGKAA